MSKLWNGGKAAEVVSRVKDLNVTQDTSRVSWVYCVVHWAIGNGVRLGSAAGPVTPRLVTDRDDELVHRAVEFEHLERHRRQFRLLDDKLPFPLWLDRTPPSSLPASATRHQLNSQKANDQHSARGPTSITAIHCFVPEPNNNRLK